MHETAFIGAAWYLCALLRHRENFGRHAGELPTPLLDVPETLEH